MHSLEYKIYSACTNQEAYALESCSVFDYKGINDTLGDSLIYFFFNLLLNPFNILLLCKLCNFQINIVHLNIAGTM